VSDDTNGTLDIFVRDLTAGTTVRASLDSSGVEGNSISDSPSLSADGSRVAFASVANNLVSGDTNLWSDIFVRDLAAGTTTRVSVDSSGAQSNQASYGDDDGPPSLSADGTRVAFVSWAGNLVSGDTNGLPDVFVRDLSAGTTQRVSVSSAGSQADFASYHPSLAGDGSRVAFHSYATNLVSGDTNSVSDVFVRDLTAGTTVRVSVDAVGAQGNHASIKPSLSADGTRVAFESSASNLVSGDTNNRRDVFVTLP